MCNPAAAKHAGTVNEGLVDRWRSQSQRQRRVQGGSGRASGAAAQGLTGAGGASSSYHLLMVSAVDDEVAAATGGQEDLSHTAWQVTVATFIGSTGATIVLALLAYVGSLPARNSDATECSRFDSSCRSPPASLKDSVDFPYCRLSAWAGCGSSGVMRSAATSCRRTCTAGGGADPLA